MFNKWIVDNVKVTDMNMESESKTRQRMYVGIFEVVYVLRCEVVSGCRLWMDGVMW